MLAAKRAWMPCWPRNKLIWHVRRKSMLKTSNVYRSLEHCHDVLTLSVTVLRARLQHYVHLLIMPSPAT